MKQLTTDSPNNNMETLLNYAHAEMDVLPCGMGMARETSTTHVVFVPAYLLRSPDAIANVKSAN